MSGETILVVEDDGLIALYLTELLEKTGYLVGAASSGESALKVLEKSPVPDLILMDIGLAGSLDGIETLREIRKQFSMPVIFISAYTSPGILERIRDVGPDGYIVKPFLDKDLLDLVRKIIDKRAQGDR
jgi:two-component system, response regulator PdtaR